MSSFDWDAIPTEVPRDRWKRPLVIPPGGGKPMAYTRCTTFAGSIEDTYNLSLWQQRMVALGLAERPDLMVSVAAYHDDKEELNRICESALEAARAKAAAGVGTALHKLTDRLDRGEPLGPVPAEYMPDLEAFRAATAGLEVLGVERFVVCDELRIGGTFDRLYGLDGQVFIGDTKTGNITYGAGKIAMQLAIYSRSLAYDPATGTRTLLAEEVNQDLGIIVHMAAGTGVVELHWVDLTAGWEAVRLAADVRDWRRRKGLIWPLKGLGLLPMAEAALSEVFSAEPVSLLEQVRTATTAEALAELWQANQAAWTDELTTAARDRKVALHQARLKGAVNMARMKHATTSSHSFISTLPSAS